MTRNERRLAREAKHFPFAHGVTHTRPILAAGSHFNAANDSSDEYCLRCGHEGHTSSECTRPIPACGATEDELALARMFGGDVDDGLWVDARERGTRAGGAR